MKKILVFCVAIAMIFRLNAIPVAAENEVEFYVTAPESAVVGDTIEVVFGIRGSYEAHVLTTQVEFDTRSLEYIETRHGDALTAAALSGGASVLYDLTTDGTAVSLGVMMLIDPMSNEGDLMIMTFRVLETADNAADFNIKVTTFGYMPLGEQTATPIKHTCTNDSTSLSGGSGEGNNGGDGSVVNTPAPITSTDEPNVTSEPVTTSVPSDSTNAPDDSTINETELPDDGTTPDPEATEDADTAIPGTVDKDKKDGLSTTVIIIICIGAVVVLGAAGFVVTKLLKKKSASK